ncbi:MAG: histidine phosphatase family protein [Actinobacteria bacterium]|nr:histidine phosphatase family protein [Actinomycetota bacterium]
MTSDRSPEIVLLRHGESEWSRSGRFAGRVDVALTERGRREMTAMGRLLKEWTFTDVLCSPLQRARDSCRLAGLGDAAQLRPELIEWEYGSYEGRTAADIAAERSGWSLWRDGAPAGETVEMVGRRLGRLVAELRRAGGDVALFAHRDVLRVFTALWLGLRPQRGRHFLLATASLSVLGREGDVPTVLRWNEHVDLPDSAPP